MAQSAGNSATTYIASIKKYEESENLEDATNIKNFILKSCEEFVTAENVSGLTKILNEIPLVPFPCFYLGPLTAKLQLYQKLSNDDFHSLILRIIQIPVDLADYSKDANLAMFYFPLLRALGEAAIHKKCPLLAIKPLADGIRWWTDGNPRHLTPVHASLLCCCLKARNFRYCMEFLEIDALSLVKEGLQPRKVMPPLINCTTEPVLLYFYYGSLIHALHENFREALNFLEYLISMRGMSQSTIVLEGFKKAILFALILGEKKLTFPGSKVVKYLLNHSQSRPYLELAWIVTTAPKHIDISALVVEYLERQRNKNAFNVFQKDQNMGLIEILMEKLKERKIIDLPKTFTAVTRKQAMERTFVQETQQFDSLIRKLVAQGKLKCTIDHDNGILTFPQDDEASERDQKELDSALLAVSKLTTVVRDATNLLKVAEAGNIKLKKRTVAFGMSKKNADNPEVIEFTEKIGRLKIDDLPVFFEEFNKIYTELIERKQLLEEEFLLEEEKIPVLKKQIRKAIEDIATLKKELISAGDKTRKLILEQKKRFEKECPEEALAVEKILTLKKELDVLLFSKEFKKLVEQANLMIDSRSFENFRETFDKLVKLPETSENYLPPMEASYQHEFEENRKIFAVNLKKMLYDRFASLKFPFEQAVDLQAVKGELDIVTDILHSLHVVFKKGESEMSILQLVFDEFTKRFDFHFYGDKPTNSDAKPEWFFAEISAWISANLPFIVGHLQSLFIQLGEEEVLVAEEFIENLVLLATKKVDSLISNETFVDDDKLLSHLIDETVLFEKELSEVYLYPESSPHVISELCRPDILERWIRMEQTTISAGIDSILSDPGAYESRFKDAADVDEHLVPNFADAFVLLMNAMAERYRIIPDDRVQCRFLKLQLTIVDEFRGRMVQISSVIDNPLNHPNPQLLNAFWYMSQVLDEWSVLPEFIRLQNFMESKTVTVRGTFDDQSGLYRHVWRQKSKVLTQYFADLVSFKLKPYAALKWFQVENSKPVEITPQFLPFLTEIQRLVEWINEEISPISVMTFYHLTNHEIWNALDEIVVSQTNFHYRGAAQMLFDVTNGLIPLLESLYKWPKVTAADGILNKKCLELLNALRILSLPSPTAILLREEVEKNPEQMLEEKLQPFNVSGLSKRRVLEIFKQRCDLNMIM